MALQGSVHSNDPWRRMKYVPSKCRDRTFPWRCANARGRESSTVPHGCENFKTRTRWHRYVWLMPMPCHNPCCYTTHNQSWSCPNPTTDEPHITLDNTWFVPKVSALIFYLNVYWTHLKLQVISFKVWPLGSYTVVPTFFPLIIAVLEVIFRKCV